MPPEDVAAIAAKLTKRVRTKQSEIPEGAVRRMCRNCLCTAYWHKTEKGREWVLLGRDGKPHTCRISAAKAENAEALP